MRSTPLRATDSILLRISGAAVSRAAATARSRRSAPSPRHRSVSSSPSAGRRRSCPSALAPPTAAPSRSWATGPAAARTAASSRRPCAARRGAGRRWRRQLGRSRRSCRLVARWGPRRTTIGDRAEGYHRRLRGDSEDRRRDRTHRGGELRRAISRRRRWRGCRSEVREALAAGAALRRLLVTRVAVERVAARKRLGCGRVDVFRAGRSHRNAMCARVLALGHGLRRRRLQGAFASAQFLGAGRPAALVALSATQKHIRQQRLRCQRIKTL